MKRVLQKPLRRKGTVKDCNFKVGLLGILYHICFRATFGITYDDYRQTNTFFDE